MRRSWVFSVFLCMVVLIAGCTGGSGNGSSEGEQRQETNQGAGQSGGSAGGTTAGQAEQSGQAEQEEGLPMKDGKYDPPVTITTVRGIIANLKFRPGETIDDNVMTRWAEERLGIKVKNLWSVTDTNNAFATKLRLTLASNEPLPDVIYIGGANPQIMHDLIDSGRFQEVGSLFEKYASDVWKQAMSIDETVWYAGTRDGKRYAIPNLEFMNNNNTVVWVREDWREELGLPEPKTIEDLEVILEAFKTKKNATVPLTIGFQNGFISSVADTAPIFGAYGNLPTVWQLGEDGALVYGSIQPGIKDALAKLREWNEKGYISSESALWDGTKATEPFLAGKSGVIIAAPWMPQSRFNDLFKNEPDAKVRPFDIPIGPEGKAGRQMGSIVQGYMLINKEMEHPEILFTYQNYIMDNYGTRKEGSEFQYGLAKGYDWDIIDGVPVTDPARIEDFTQVQHYTLFGNGGRIPDKFYKLRLDINEKIKNGIPLTPQEEVEYGLIAPSWEGYMVAYTTPEHYNIKNMFTGSPTPAMVEYKEYLDTLEMETFSKIIYGSLPIDAFDQFVQQWKSSGGDEITKEVNEWYQSVK